MKKVLITLSLAAMISCTENSRARSWGGSETVTLKKNEVLVNLTWKNSDLWILSKDTLTNVKYLREISSWGIIEGEIVIK
jgi:hypothetical protein